MIIVGQLLNKALFSLSGRFGEDEGQGLAEYGLILALVAVVCAAALVVLQGGISNTLNSVAGSL